jgi:murein DD-endopeptidase MepM/ murein hydrolase activator NlpD
MRRFDIHRTAGPIRIKIASGSDFIARARWGLTPGLVAEPPTEVRGPLNYSANPEVFIAGELAPDRPLYLPLDPLWWDVQRYDERNIYCVVEFRHPEDAAWSLLADFVFVVDQDPVANAGRDQIVQLDAAGAIVADVTLDGSASDDRDLHAAVNPDPGPLIYDWSCIHGPPNAQGTLPMAAAMNVGPVASPVFLLAGTVVPPEARGAYRFQLEVRDTNVATIGSTAGQPGKGFAETRVLVGGAAGALVIQMPTTAEPYIGNAQDGIAVTVWYSIGDALANDPAYANGWQVRLTLRQAIESPIIPGRAVGEPVYVATTTSSHRVGSFAWAGTATFDILRNPTPNGGRAFGAFDIELELLDRTGASTGVPASRVTMPRSIALDLFRWLIPLDSGVTSRLTGAFMETGHAGYRATAMHGGIDLAAAGPPAILAARSGFRRFVGGNTNTIEVTHGIDRTRYLHGVAPVAYPANALVVQGAPLATMGSAGTVGAHLHFQMEAVDANQNTIGLVNPLFQIGIRDTQVPSIDRVLVRAAGLPGADLTQPAVDIAGQVDVIVLCRDNADPAYQSANGSFLAPFGLELTDGGAPAGSFSFDALDDTLHASRYYATQSIGAYPAGNVADRYYLLYLRLATAGYAATGPRTYTARVRDFGGRAVARPFVIGGDAQITFAPAVPATTHAAPAPFGLTVRVDNRLSQLDATVAAAAASDNFYLSLVGAPAGWTVSPARTGAIGGGASAAVAVTIDPHGVAPAGNHAFDLVIASGILHDVRTRVAITVTVG